MRSKLTLALLLPLAVVLGGCGDYFLKRQGPPAQEQVEIKMGGLSCLRQAPANLNAWLGDRLSVEETQGFFNCLYDTLGQFQKFTRGTEKPEQYTAEELRGFLNEVLPESHKMPASLMGEIMRLKTVLIGGSAAIMTKPEIERARLLVDLLEKEAVSLRGMMRLLLFQAPKEQVEPAALAAAQRQFEKSVSNILRVSKPEAADYTFADITSFVSEMDGYLGNHKILSKLLRWLPLTQKFKLLFLGDRTLAYSQQDWQEVLGWSARAYGLVLEFVYKVRAYDLDSPSDMEKLISFGDRIFDLVGDSPVLKEKGQLSLDALDEVIGEAMTQNLIRIGVNRPVLQETFRKALMTMVEGPGAQRREIFEMDGLTRRHYTTLRHEWNIFVLAQRGIDKFFLSNQKRNFAAFVAALNESEIQAEVKVRARKPGEASALLRAWNEWRSLVADPHPVVWDQLNRLAIRQDPQNITMGFRGTTVSNLLRSFTRGILRGYGTSNKSTNIWHFELDEAQFTRFEEDFHEFGEAVHFLDNRTKKRAARTMQEANFFTFNGNGDDRLDGRELFEELNILSSAGGMIANDIMGRALAAGCGIDKVDVFGKPYLEKSCYDRVFKRDFGKVFQSAPGLMALQTSLVGQPLEADFYSSIAEIAHQPFSIPGLVEYGDIRTSATILYYTEILRMIYDADSDMLLSESEIANAAPRFHSFIAKKSPLGDWMMVDTFFSCLVFEQTKPGMNWPTTNCVTLGWYGYDPVSPAVLLKVLAVLKADMVQTQGGDPQQQLMIPR